LSGRSHLRSWLYSSFTPMRTSVRSTLSLHDALPICGRRFAGTVVDIGAQGVQRHAAFAIPLFTGDFDTVQTAGRHDLDAQGTQTDRKSTRLNSSHRTISYAVFCLKKKKHSSIVPAAD